MFGTGEDTVTPPPTTASAGKLTITSSLSFANVALGLASSPSAVTVTNSGDDPVLVASIQSSNAGEFSVSGSTCKSIAAGASCTFNVTFSPFYTGPRTATITVTSNAPGSAQTVQVSGAGDSGGPPPPAPPPGAMSAIEYYHAAFDHYFITASADEIGKLDAGTFAGWVRTGRQFNVFAAPATGLRTACRFFSTAFGARSSHFYTPDAPECSTVRGESGLAVRRRRVLYDAAWAGGRLCVRNEAGVPHVQQRSGRRSEPSVHHRSFSTRPHAGAGMDRGRLWHPRRDDVRAAVGRE